MAFSSPKKGTKEMLTQNPSDFSLSTSNPRPLLTDLHGQHHLSQANPAPFLVFFFFFFEHKGVRSPSESWRKPLCLGFVILFCLRTFLRKASARTRLAYAKTHGQTLVSASLTRTESSMMLLNVNLASASLPRRLV